MMKIVHCVNQYMPVHMAGTEVYIHTLSAFQQAAGHQVAVLSPHIEHYRPGQLRDHYVYDGTDVYQYLEPADPTNRDHLSGKKKPEGLAAFRKLLDMLKPDIIHFHELNRSIGLGVEHVKIAKQSGAKVILTMHLSFYTCNTNTLVRDGRRLCVGKILEYECSVCSYITKFNMPAVLAVPAAMVAIASAKTGMSAVLPVGKATTLITMPLAIRRIKNELMELVGVVDRFVSLTQWYRKILLENGVPDQKITVISQALATIDNPGTHKSNPSVAGPLKIVFVGRVQEQKGIHLLIAALQNFSSGEVVADIYGRPEDTDYYRRCVADSNSNSAITWKGEIAREDVVPTLAKYDLLCLPSVFSEMSPLVIQEAFAAGIPVLASEVYGNMEQVTDGYNGLLFEFNNAPGLGRQIALAVSNRPLLQQMKNNIVPPRRFEAVHRAYLDVYKGRQAAPAT